MPPGKGGLAFLAKKSWHTAKISNQERVWQAEKDRAQEERRVEALKRQIEDERQEEEMRQLQGQHTPKLDWMYASAASRAAAQPQDTEKFLLGAKWQPKEDNIVKDMAKSGAAGSTFMQDDKDINSAAAYQDDLAKTYVMDNGMYRLITSIRADPMLAIMRAQKQKKEELLSNPVRMDALKRQALESIRAKQERKAAKKAAKKARKHGRDRSRSISPAERRRRSRSRSRDRGRRHGRSRSRSRERRRDRSRERGRDWSPDQCRRRSPVGGRDGSGRSAADGAPRRVGGLHLHPAAQAAAKAADAAVSRARNAAEPSAKQEGGTGFNRFRTSEAEHDRRAGMSAEEKARRLAEMRGDAVQHEVIRSDRIRKKQVEEDREQAAGMGDRGAGVIAAEEGNFLAQLNKQTFLAGAGGGLEERLSTRKHYHQRRGYEDGNSFKR